MGYASGVDDVAAAIADPVRRQILEMLRERSLPARRIAERFPISRPAVSRHLRVLRECGLVHDTPEGRERHYRLDPSPFTPLSDWLAGFAAPASASADVAASAGFARPVGFAAVGSGQIAPAGQSADPADGEHPADTGAALWNQRLDALETEVHRTRRERRRGAADPDRQENTA